MPDILLLVIAAVLLGVGAVLTARYPKSAWPHGAGIVAVILGAVFLVWWVILLADSAADSDAAAVRAAVAAVLAR